MRYYLLALLGKMLSKLRHPEEFSHVSWGELFSYTLRQGFQLWQGQGTACLASYRYVDEHDAALDTPWGTLFVPRVLDKTALRYLLRETLDVHHWHHFDTPETPVVPGDVVVDCGASEGLWALSVVGKVRKIYLIEPQAAFIRVLKKTFAEVLASGTADILYCAVGSHDGTCSIVSGSDADLMSTVVPSSNGSIPLQRLDTLFPEQHVDFIKADIEGAEMELVQGGTELIRRCRPKIALTVYHAPNDWRALCAYVQGIDASYRWRLTGMTAWGKPLMLHLWVPDRCPT